MNYEHPFNRSTNIVIEAKISFNFSKIVDPSIKPSLQLIGCNTVGKATTLFIPIHCNRLNRLRFKYKLMYKWIQILLVFVQHCEMLKIDVVRADRLPVWMCLCVKWQRWIISSRSRYKYWSLFTFIMNSFSHTFNALKLNSDIRTWNYRLE